MRLIGNCTLALAALAMAQASTASEWWFVADIGKKPARTVYFIDKAGIRSIGASKRQAWSSLYYETPSQPRHAITEKQLWEYDCEARTGALVSYIEYDADGGTLQSKTASVYERNLEPMAPDTIGDASLSFVCGDETKALKIDQFETALSGRIVLAILDRQSAK